MKQLKTLFRLFISYSILFATTQISAHGFCRSTKIKLDHGIHSIIDICEQKLCAAEGLDYDDLLVAGYDLENNNLLNLKIKSAAIGKTNCYLRISFDSNPSHDIICSPIQEFYLYNSQEWLPAYKLNIGDNLLSSNKQLKPITSIKLVKKPLGIAMIEVNSPHNFFVGYHSVLTHNIALPAMYAGFSIAFGSGAVAGGTAGSFFGPLTLCGGILIGGLIAVGVHCVFGEVRIPKYQIEIDTRQIERYINRSEAAPADKPEQSPTEKPEEKKPEESKTQGEQVQGEQPKAEEGKPTKTPADLVSESEPGKKTKGKTTQYTKPGTFEDANKDFDSLGVNGVRDISRQILKEEQALCLMAEK